MPTKTAAEDNTYKWLDRVESSVEMAHSILLGAERAALPELTSEMEFYSQEREQLAATPAMAPRLLALRERLTVLQSLLRQAVAFVEGREQMDSEAVLGYTPRGLERAL
jgi:hypothetical protein